MRTALRRDSDFIDGLRYTRAPFQEQLGTPASCIATRHLYKMKAFEIRFLPCSLSLSRTQPLDFPPCVFPVTSCISESIVQPAVPPLPKFHHYGQDPQPTPKLGHRDLFHSLEPLLYLLHTSLQHLPPSLAFVQHLTLLARPRTHATAPGPEVVIHLALGSAQPLHTALDPYLPLQRRPPKRQAGLGITPHVGCFAARFPIAVDDEAPVVEFLQIDEPGRHGARRQGGGREADRFRLMDSRGLLSVLEPGMELRQRVWFELMEFERCLGVLVGLRGALLPGWGD